MGSLAAKGRALVLAWIGVPCLLVLSATGCGRGFEIEVDGPELAVLEAAFRHLLEHNGVNARVREDYDVIFFAVGDCCPYEDPPPELMARFGDLPSVRPISSSVAVPEDVPSSERERRVVLAIEKLVPTPQGYRIEYGYSGGCMGWGSFEFEQRDGSWQAVSGGLRFIS